MISDHFSMSAMVDDSTVDSWAISKAVLNGSEFFMDLSGCRLSDVTLAADSEKLNPGTCLKEVCDKHAVASTVSSCGAKEVCQDNVKCGIQHNDTIDSSINCNRSTEHCNLMRQAPFTACHDRIDPEPYITACTNTLCNYPAVDGLNCQLLEAYAKACSLKNVTLKNWRSTVGCCKIQFDFYY
ncbi:mucin-5B-like [Sebastes umbrosus]|nr:mucin-5B-like [Sebastes umbrosus]